MNVGHGRHYVPAEPRSRCERMRGERADRTQGRQRSAKMTLTSALDAAQMRMTDPDHKRRRDERVGAVMGG